MFFKCKTNGLFTKVKKNYRNCVFIPHLKHMCDKLSPKRRVKCCLKNPDRGRIIRNAYT